MTRRVKVLQLQNSYNVSASDLAEQIIRGLPEDRYEVTTAFLRGRPGSGDPVSCASRSVYFELEQGDTKGLRWRALTKLYTLCRQERYEVVIGHRVKPINMLMWLNRWFRFPACIGVLHGLGEYDRAYRRWILRRLITRSWRLVGVSRAVYDDLQNCNISSAPDTICQINNAIDIELSEALQLPRESARHMLELPADAFIFGSIGRLVPVKAHTVLLDAFARIRKAYPQAMVVVIGEGRSREELESLIKHHGMGEQVHLVGALDDAMQYVRAFDAFVMPSRSEGLPLALLEAMSGRLPVIGSDIDSVRPLIEDCGGRHFPVDNPEALAERLREVIALPQKTLREEGERAYAYLCRSHSIDDFRRQYRELIDELLTDKCRTQ